MSGTDRARLRPHYAMTGTYTAHAPGHAITCLRRIGPSPGICRRERSTTCVVDRVISFEVVDRVISFEMNVRCAMCDVRCAMCNVQCAMCDVQCAMCNVQCAAVTWRVAAWPAASQSRQATRSAPDAPRNQMQTTHTLAVRFASGAWFLGVESAMRVRFSGLTNSSPFHSRLHVRIIRICACVSYVFTHA
eukprot:663514-Rhodomonas_salina.1